MKTKLLALIIFAAGSMLAQSRFSIGVNIGGGYRPHPYAPARVYVAPSYIAPAYVEPSYGYGYAAAVPQYPRPGYTWVEGYWSNPGYGRRAWVSGYWRATISRYGYAGPRYYNRGYRR